MRRIAERSQLGRGQFENQMTLALAVTQWLPRMTKGFAVSSEALGFIGGANRDRTGDLYNAIVALSQLSYGPAPPPGT